MAGTVVISAAPRIIWGASLVPMLISIFMCPGGMICGPVNPEKVLSGHFVCMSIAWPVLMTEALLCWRAPLFRSKNARVFKAVHGLLQTLAGGFIILGTVFAIVYKLPSNNRHFWSVHAWIGAGAIALYCLQYPLGLYVYLVSSMTPSQKAGFYKYHRYLGLATYIAGLAAGVNGLMETQEFYQPGVAFTGPDSYSAATLLLAAKAFLSLLLGLCVTYAWVVLPQVGKAPPEHAPGATCGAQVGKAQEGVDHQDHPSAQSMFGPVGRLQVFKAPEDA